MEVHIHGAIEIGNLHIPRQMSGCEAFQIILK